MIFELLDTNIIVLALALFLCIYSRVDKSFDKTARMLFYYAALFVSSLVLIDTIKTFAEINKIESIAMFACAVRSILRPIVLLCVIYVVLRDSKKKIRVYLAIPVLINAVLCGASVATKWMFYYDENFVHHNTLMGIYSFALSGIYLLIMLITSIVEARRYGKKDYTLVGFIFLFVILSVVLELVGPSNYMLDATMATSVVLYYLYLKGETYKLDPMTGLFNRYNLKLDTMNLLEEDYDVIFIDIDNFKLINDKYGHIEGDKAICEVVDTIRKNLLPKSTMYRYGGDEFVIVSQAAGEEQIKEMFVLVDQELEEKNYSISYGLVHHEPGEVFQEVCDRADMLMYERKRKAKSEDIWDQMTGLFNLRGFVDELELQKKHILNSESDIALVCVDIDHLGSVNEIYGHKEGDELIRRVAKLLDGLVTKGEFVGHISSNEFMVAITVKDQNDPYAEEFVKQIEEQVKVFNTVGEQEYTLQLNHIVCFVGMKPDTDVNTAIEEAFYKQRISKNNRRHYDGSKDHEEIFAYSAEDEKQVVEIIEENRLSYVYQPIVSAGSGEIVGYETLMRAPEDAKFSPFVILEYATKNQLLYEIEKRTFFNNFKLYDESIKEQFPDRKIFINSMPAHQLDEKDFAKLTHDYPGLIKNFVVEVIEKDELDGNRLLELRRRSEQYEFDIAIDDYGTGYSNTSNVLRYAPGIIKIDRFLIQGIESDNRKQHFVSSVITYAHENGIKVLAEGVETEKEVRTVLFMGVDLLQGYYIARPKVELMEEIPAEIKDKLIKMNLQRHEQEERKVYLATKDTELSIMKLAMDRYTGIMLGDGEIAIKGAGNYAADMSIRIKDDSELRLVLSDVELKDAYKLPCLELGERVKLTLVLEGDNFFNGGGILVPESSEIIFKGRGNLRVATKGHDCYGIGNGPSASVGKLVFSHSGLIDVAVDGNRCCAIGGGASSNSMITASSGKIKVDVAAESGVGIGSFDGRIPIRLDSTSITAMCRVRDGAIIGSLSENLDIKITNYEVIGDIAGTNVAGIGAAGVASGTLDFMSGSINLEARGQQVVGIGSFDGDVEIKSSNAGITFLGEGNCVTAIGTIQNTATVDFNDGKMVAEIHSGKKTLTGCKEGGLQLSEVGIIREKE